ncbi:hypothetical protein CONPUDRAFT_92561 [Coniophora puteana RWD-64-598 SS2]|uniref:Ferritin-like domain-containing protein n=1 Tax=Coniophora puteana (strain RWD-64-598) TaxID=741705 RepID=A0A5M3MEM9_CONPW|nr:uncharacterized protein CONPUDRAFT_92561 [Coniophora puteana RWD-64-598 SS2]EIW77466.1 hypothetical protein CONPUDRAFT_92561 [Coniophora puteana RWD-64-598 SS2]
MMFSATFTSLCLAAVAVALPAEKRAAPTVTDILNYALTLEHLENAFYAEGINNFTQQSFIDAGLPGFAAGRFSEIAQHEATHVQFLTGALGEDATQACDYNFPVTDAKSFAQVSYLLENVGTSAYSGAAQYLSGGTLTAAAAILAVEARHSAWVNSAVLKANPWNGAFDTPLDLNQIYTLATSIITSCPSSNPALPVKAFPALTFGTDMTAGQATTVSFNGSDASSANGMYVGFISGMNTTIVPVQNGQVTIPDGLMGVVYAVATSSDSMTSDNVTLAGPAFLSFDFKSDALLL